MCETPKSPSPLPAPQSRRWLPPTGLEVESLRQHVATGTIVVLDVRDEASFRRGHIPNALHAPDSSPGRLAVEATRHPRVALVCDTGKMSALIARTLKVAGTADPCYLVGGLRAWAAAGLDLTQIAEDGRKHRRSPETRLERTTRRIRPVAGSLNRRVLFASLAGSAAVLGMALLWALAGRT
jgi:rhodanese-related sulfurtransferase